MDDCKGFLVDQHRNELRASGLSDQTIKTSGIYTAENSEIADILGWHPKAHRWGRGFVVPFFDADGKENCYRRVKLDYPRSKDGNPRKYEAPIKTPARAYFPPGFAGALAQGKTIIIVEGEKKALAVAQLGYAVIALLGVWAWQQRRLRDDRGKAYGKRKLINDLDAFEWKDRDVVIVFDSDAADNRLIQLAEARLSEALTKLGAAGVRVARIPGDAESKVGVDDFLVAKGDAGPERLRRLIDTAEPAEVPDECEVMDWARALVEDQFMRPGARTLQWHCDEFYQWIGVHYRKIAESELRALVLKWLDKRGVKKATPRFAGDIVKCLESLCHVPFIREQPCFLVDGGKPEFAEPTNIVAFANGLLDVSTLGGNLTLRDHTPRWFSTSALAYPFDPKADCPEWLEFTEQVFDKDPERIDLLQRWFGLLLTADTSYQKLLLMVGPRRSGKGTICRTIQHVFGADACTSPTLTSLGTEFGLWPLLGKTVAMFPDAHVGRAGDAMRILETMKSIVGEDCLNVNRKYMQILSGVRLRVRFVVTVNELPHFSDASGALAARLCVLPFDQSFVGREDRELEGKLKAEASGILNWGLRGLSRLRTEGSFNTPGKSAAVLDNYSRLSSPVGAFVGDCCETGPTKQVECAELYEAYLTWASGNGHRKITQATFGERLRAVNPSIKRTRPREGTARFYAYEGVDLNEDGRRILAACRAAKPGCERAENEGWS